MNKHASSDALIGNENPSTSKVAAYNRIRRLTNDAASDATDACNRKCRNKKKQKHLIARADSRASSLIRFGSMEARVRFHLSRGRDAADIVMREGIKASIILAIVAKIKAEA